MRTKSYNSRYLKQKVPVSFDVLAKLLQLMNWKHLTTVIMKRADRTFAVEEKELNKSLHKFSKNPINDKLAQMRRRWGTITCL